MNKSSAPTLAGAPRIERCLNRLVDDGFNRAREENAHPRDWRNPVSAVIYNLVVIGAGPAGMTAAREAATLGAKVALIERNLVGGSSLNVGCVPSKTLIRTGRFYDDMRKAENYGARPPCNIVIDFPLAMERIRQVQARLSRVTSAQRLSELGVDIFFGEARFSGMDRVKVAGQVLRFRKAIIATGARPLTSQIPGLTAAGYLTNENVFNLTECPRRLMVIGGGPLGCEMAQAFCRLGIEVTIAQHSPMFLPREESDAAQILGNAPARDGVQLHLNTDVIAVRTESGQKVVDLLSAGKRCSIIVDEILVGVGRSPNVEDVDLEVAGVDYNIANGVITNEFLQTTNAKIYAAGDVCLQHKFAHAAEASARLALQNALFFGHNKVSAITIPWCTYTDPEIAHVGLYVREAREKAIPVKTFTILMQDVDRAVADGEDEGFAKIHLRQGTDRILGATLVARHAGEMMNGISVAMSSGIGLRALARVIHAYPTQAEAIKMAADAYNRSRLTPRRKVSAERWLSR